MSFFSSYFPSLPPFCLWYNRPVFLQHSTYLLTERTLKHEDYCSHLFDEQKALSVLPCVYRGAHITISNLNDNINVYHDESSGTIRVKQPQSVWQLITVLLQSKTIGIIYKTTYYTDYQLKEDRRQHTQTCTNTFLHTAAKIHWFICEVKPIINPKGLSIKLFLLTDKRSTWRE